MSFQVPDFLTEEDSPVFPRKTHESAGDDFVELIWQKGPIFRRRSPDPPHGDSALRFLSNPRAASGVSTHTATTAAAAYLPSTTELFMEEDEMASWLYYPLGGDDDPGGVGTVAGVNPTEQPRETAAEALPDPDFFPPAAADRAVEADGWAATGRPPRHPQAQGISTDCLGAPRPRPASGESTVVNTSATTTEPGRSRPWAESRVFSGDARVGAAACELGPASSSGLSCNGEEAGASAAAMAVGRGDERKRRAREDDDGCDSHSEDGEFESSGGKRRDSRRSASARRSRAAQVHNLSERRRRDRINEKMKALQQLIPRCHKSDKASMLDDAIEYMKSLKMQVQMMSMCCNMTPMMFPGVQQYMPSLGMGMPMGMNMGMGMGMAMRMDMSHPMMPCPTLMPAAQMAANGAPHLTQRLPVQAAHAPVAAFAEQMRLQATNQADPTSSSACIRTPGEVQMPNLPAVLHQARSQNPASAIEAGISKRTSCMPADKSKQG